MRDAPPGLVYVPVNDIAASVRQTISTAGQFIAGPTHQRSALAGGLTLVNIIVYLLANLWLSICIHSNIFKIGFSKFTLITIIIVTTFRLTENQLNLCMRQ